MNVLILCQELVKAGKRGAWFAQRWRRRAAEADTSMQAPWLLLLLLPETV